jgi:hypothetical protein
MTGLTIRNKSKTSVSKTGPTIKYTDLWMWDIWSPPFCLDSI